MYCWDGRQGTFFFPRILRLQTVWVCIIGVWSPSRWSHQYATPEMIMSRNATSGCHIERVRRERAREWPWRGEGCCGQRGTEGEGPCATWPLDQLFATHAIFRIGAWVERLGPRICAFINIYGHRSTNPTDRNHSAMDWFRNRRAADLKVSRLVTRSRSLPRARRLRLFICVKIFPQHFI